MRGKVDNKPGVYAETHIFRRKKGCMAKFTITDEMIEAGYDALRDPKTGKPADWIVLGTDNWA